MTVPPTLASTPPLPLDAADPSAPVNILLVDDRPENLLALEALLEPLGERLVRATSGDEALRALLASDFAVILLDVQMPGINGFETAQLIKARERSRHIPIIFLTAINTADVHVYRGYAVGAVDYLAKPFEPDVLRSKVAVFVDLYRKQEQLRRQEQLLRDVERREVELQHRAELLESRALLAEVVGSALDAIILLDAGYTVRRANAAAERMFGRHAGSIVGLPVAELFADDEVEALLGRSAGAGDAPNDGEDTGRAPALPLTARHRLSGPFPTEASVSRLTLGESTSYTLIVRDISERWRAEEALRTQAASLAASTAKLATLNAELQRRQAELQHAMTARNRFYASMSHELRTPINAIIGYSTLLLDNVYGPLNERQMQGLHRTHKAARHLLELVNDVLDLSKIEAGKIELGLQPVVFPTLVEDLFVTVRPMADERGTAIHLDQPNDSVTVVTDPRRVRQILLNLLSNAIKFGQGRPIVVRCTGREAGGVEIEVIDQGGGIATADQLRIFDEFVQLQPHAGGAEGTGLGLSISQRLARLLGGDLLLTSAPGEGSTFRLVLPAETPAETPAEAPGEGATSEMSAAR
ncbi:MAG TPA: ATP-binding protein [Gemmatimonadaceae bacterium]|jgi:PAS domain S-box-containing protein|nr:ATP-binding protein [Gemmatimonadaceae bacterium]